MLSFNSLHLLVTLTSLSVWQTTFMQVWTFSQNYDFKCSEKYKSASQILVYKELSFSSIQGLPFTFVSLSLLIWTCSFKIIYPLLSITCGCWQDVIPHMAHEYGFEYELITYKWPTWLHKQKEKQRIIWAYKILFLDVIFPLALEKVCWFCTMIFLCCLKWWFASSTTAVLVICFSCNIITYRLYSLMLIRLWGQTWENFMTWTWKDGPLRTLHSVTIIKIWMAIGFGNK